MPPQKRFRSGFNQQQRTILRGIVDEFAGTLAAELNATKYAAALEIYAWAQLFRNPTLSEKRKAWRAGGEICRACGRKLAFEKASMHHERRDVPDVDAWPNLQPFCSKCHDSEHRVEDGSLRKGGPRARQQS